MYDANSSFTFAVWDSESCPEGVTLPAHIRVRWVYDDHYETKGSYGLDTEEETREAENNETGKLDSGEWVALGCLVEARDSGEELDALWGIVLSPSDQELVNFFNHSMDIPDKLEAATRTRATAQARYKAARKDLLKANADVASAAVGGVPQAEERLAEIDS